MHFMVRLLLPFFMVKYVFSPSFLYVLYLALNIIYLVMNKSNIV